MEAIICWSMHLLFYFLTARWSRSILVSLLLKVQQTNIQVVVDQPIKLFQNNQHKTQTFLFDS